MLSAECSGKKMNSVSSRFHISFQISLFLQKFFSGCKVGSDPCYSQFHVKEKKRKKGNRYLTPHYWSSTLVISFNSYDILKSISFVPGVDEEAEVNELRVMVGTAHEWAPV